MDAILLLCDHADVAGGKLYINGGGWSQIPANQPVHMGIAVKLNVSWDQTNIQHAVIIRLVTEDGGPVLNPDGVQWNAEATLEVGRPPGLKHGVPIDAPLAVNFPGVFLPAGGYRWELLVDDKLLSDAAFQVIELRGSR